MDKEPTFLGNILSMVPIIAIFIVMFWLMSSQQRKEKKKKEELAKSFKKGLKVQTVGGIIGTIEEIKDDNIILMVDTRNKVTLTFHRDSIATTVE